MGVKHGDTQDAFPLRQFIRQLFFSPLSTVVWSPARFWFFYKIQFLQQCWNLEDTYEVDSLRLLERCWLMQSILPPNEISLQDSPDNQEQQHLDK
jgi:hypothetical protein